MQTITIGELRKFIAESATKNEFKPVYGKGAKNGGQIIDKANQEHLKQVATYDGGKKTPSKTSEDANDENLGMSDLQYDNTNELFQKRMKAMTGGYTSPENEKLHTDEFEGNVIYDKQHKNFDKAKARAKANKDERVKQTMLGLKGRELNKKEVESNHKTAFDEGRTIKKLTFNKIEFLSEGHMLTKIPDEYKKNGTRFIMRDSKANEYLVEWADNKANVTKKVNLVEAKKERDRIKQLWEYNSQDFNKKTTVQSRLNEDNGFEDMLNKARRLM